MRKALVAVLFVVISSLLIAAAVIWSDARSADDRAATVEGENRRTAAQVRELESKSAAEIRESEALDKKISALQSAANDLRSTAALLSREAASIHAGAANKVVDEINAIVDRGSRPADARAALTPYLEDLNKPDALSYLLPRLEGYLRTLEAENNE
jgi:hypothetical protein